PQSRSAGATAGQEDLRPPEPAHAERIHPQERNGRSGKHACARRTGGAGQQCRMRGGARKWGPDATELSAIAHGAVEALAAADQAGGDANVRFVGAGERSISLGWVSPRN